MCLGSMQHLGIGKLQMRTNLVKYDKPINVLLHEIAPVETAKKPKGFNKIGFCGCRKGMIKGQVCL